VKFASPLVLREHDRERNKDRYITVEDDDFAEYFQKIVFNELEMLGYGGYLAKNLSIEPLKARKIFVKAFDMNVDVSIGMFKLSGNREALQLLHDAGAGSRRSQGFGLFNIVY
jgi:CRISPR-associated endoribonuclease Cas6